MFGLHIVFLCVYLNVAPVHFAFVPLGNWAIHLSFLRESSVNLLAQKEDARRTTTDTQHSATFVWLPSPKYKHCAGAHRDIFRFGLTAVDMKPRDKEQGHEREVEKSNWNLQTKILWLDWTFIRAALLMSVFVSSHFWAKTNADYQQKLHSWTVFTRAKKSSGNSNRNTKKKK